MTNGIGFLGTNPCLVFNGKGAPWSGIASKIRECHALKYEEWSYSKDSDSLVLVIPENLVRWGEE